MEKVVAPDSEVSEIEVLREKLAKNRAERDKKVAELEEKCKRQEADHMAQMAEVEREKAARIAEYESRRARTAAVAKRSILCLLLVSLFWILMWLGQCKVSVLILVAALAVTHLAYYAGTWKMGVLQ